MAPRSFPRAAASPSADALTAFSKRALPTPSLDGQEPDTKRRKEHVGSFSPPYLPSNQVDTGAWQGFCEIESDPAFFSVLLRDMGVRGVTVREAFDVHPVMLAELPQPIYGLILLFRHREFGKTDQATECLPHVWFANQLPAQNSCATLAMMNIIMNTTDITIGEHLHQFKDFTHDFTPFQRGEAFANFDFVKKIHNSFAKSMDVLESDKHLCNKVRRANQDRSDRKVRRPSADSAATSDSTESYEENAHHFIAFVPVGNEVWKLDGLDAQPTALGTFDGKQGETWLFTAADMITTIMAAGDDDYNIIALTRSPLLSLREELSTVTNILKYLESRLNDIDVEWKVSSAVNEESPNIQALGVEDDLTLPVADTLRAEIDGEQIQELLDRRRDLLRVSVQLAADIMVEIQAEDEENQKAAQRRFDCAPVIRKWIEMLAGNGYLEDNLDKFTQKKSQKDRR